jgi:hypothetical protein
MRPIDCLETLVTNYQSALRKIPEEWRFQVTLSWRMSGAFLGSFAKLWKVTVSFVMSVCPSFRPHGTTRILLDGFSWNFIFQCFSKICRENSRLSKSDKNNGYLKACVYLWQYVADFSAREIFQTEVVDKIKTHFMSNNVFPKFVPFMISCAKIW